MSKVDPVMLADYLLYHLDCSNEQAATGIAIAMAESSLRDDAVNVNEDPSAEYPNGTEDRGLWQINNKWHPDVSDRAAYNWEGSTIWAGAQLRANNYGIWNAYKNGAWRTHATLGWTAVRAALLKTKLSDARSDLAWTQGQFEDVINYISQANTYIDRALTDVEAASNQG